MKQPEKNGEDGQPSKDFVRHTVRSCLDSVVRMLMNRSESTLSELRNIIQ